MCSIYEKPIDKCVRFLEEDARLMELRKTNFVSEDTIAKINAIFKMFAFNKSMHVDVLFTKALKSCANYPIEYQVNLDKDYLTFIWIWFKNK